MLSMRSLQIKSEHAGKNKWINRLTAREIPSRGRVDEMDVKAIDEGRNSNDVEALQMEMKKMK